MPAIRKDYDDSVHEELIKVGQVKTHVLKVGQLREQSGSQRVLMLIIPGNPGVPHYYEDFMQELYTHCEGQVPVWAIGHAGHLQTPGDSLSIQNICSTPEDMFGLEAQIKHKVDFIRENIPSDVLLVLIGHSIGCYMILNMLDQLNRSQVLRCFMLFPTIERMATSPNGLRMTPVFRYLRWLVVFTAFILSFLPNVFKRHLYKWWYRHVDYPPCMEKAILETITPWTVNYTTYLAKLEMNKVTSLQKELINKHSEKLSLYYGAVDHWAPVEYYYDLVSEFPKLDARLCNLNLKHAFVLDTQEGREMAKIVWLWAQSHHHMVLFEHNSEEEEAWVFDN
ncbi:lipid droplet-associated hydrolase-like isoform X2 [Physella acuta]|nr:lipid droplet-associated hydrolase-like isoform X2 [Physella acuta]XP_059172534.1 lipid droplet-associated hydrolase-like isoform X2 [Physella acuta]